MKFLNKIKKYLFILLPFSICLFTTSAAISQECNIINIPTLPKNSNHENMAGPCDGTLPIISLSSDRVPRGEHITVKIDSSSIGSPPYTWSISGSDGFHFNAIDGPTSATTEHYTQVLKVWADNSACGSIEITVTDKCNPPTAISIREPDRGRWELVEEISCGTLDPGPYCTCHSNYYSTQGGYRYLDSYLAGNLMGTRWHPSGGCSPYPTTNYTRDYCYCVGYYPKKYHVGIHFKKKWIWSCL